jgi:DMSO/TMAO reductase YedYZ molybdopterin-dependent catalytic subunit
VRSHWKGGSRCAASVELDDIVPYWPPDAAASAWEKVAYHNQGDPWREERYWVD